VSRNQILPYFAIPPVEYDQQYFANLTRSGRIIPARWFCKNYPNKCSTCSWIIRYGCGWFSNGDNNMSDTILTMANGSKWKPSTSQDLIHCASCDNAVDTPEEIASYPDGNCPQCGNNWTGSEAKGVRISVTAPEAISGEA
jgi:predicted RNA-binding Zn-ribbon protein involved in translation (DUF1610 family)